MPIEMLTVTTGNNHGLWWLTVIDDEVRIHSKVSFIVVQYGYAKTIDRDDICLGLKT